MSAITHDVERPLDVASRWAALKQRLAPGTEVRGVVDQVEVFGAFVDLGEEFPGLVDVVDLPDDSPQVGLVGRFRVLGFADLGHEVRLALVQD